MENAKLPNVVDLRIVGACDLRCPFCFGPRHELAPIDTKLLLPIIKQFPKHGVERVVITGGEPSLVHDLPVLLRVAKEVGLTTVLSTNGIRFQERMNEIAPYLDWVGLPLDGDTREVNGLMRTGNPQHFEMVFNLIPLIRKQYPNLRIKLGTVVCAINKHNVVGIAELIQGIYKPDVWKIYQIVYSTYGEDNQSILSLSDSEFSDIFARIATAAEKCKIRVTSYTRAEREGKYLFLEPTGDAIVISKDGEVKIGNFLTGFADVLSSWQRFVNLERMNHNFSDTYPDNNYS